MEYTYGCAPGQCELYVYHIAYMTEDGAQINLSWPEVKRRARELDLKTVPDVEGFVYDGDHEALYKKVMTLVDGEDGVSCFPSVLDPRHIEEGIAVRVEDPENGLRFMKAKNFVFGVLEGYLKEDDGYEDMEESS